MTGAWILTGYLVLLFLALVVRDVRAAWSRRPSGRRDT